MKKVLHRSPKIVLPDHTTINSLINTFGKYFADKIAKLRFGLLSTDANPPVSGSYKNKFVSFQTMSRTKSLKSLIPHLINHVTWIQSQHHWSLIVSVYSRLLFQILFPAGGQFSILFQDCSCHTLVEKS